MKPKKRKQCDTRHPSRAMGRWPGKAARDAWAEWAMTKPDSFDAYDTFMAGYRAGKKS